MRLKNDNLTPSEARVFYYIGPGKNGQEKAYKVGPANSMPQLVQWSSDQMRNQGMEVPENFAEIVEHQVCLRFQRPLDFCYSGGLGDDLHQKWIAPFLSKTADQLSKLGKLGKAVASIVNKVRTCTGCGGTRVFKSGSNNMGRAGTLNQLSKK